MYFVFYLYIFFLQWNISAVCFREYLYQEFKKTGELLVDLGSDQTSLHNPFSGGYYPVQLTFRQASQLMNTDPQRFKTLVHERYTSKQLDLVAESCFKWHNLHLSFLFSLRRHVAAINNLSDAGMFFWDYGNAFLLEAQRAGKWKVSLPLWYNKVWSDIN